MIEPQSVRQHKQNIEPEWLQAPELVHSCNTSSPPGDEFGFFIALPPAIAGGLALWGLIVWALL